MIGFTCDVFLLVMPEEDNSDVDIAGEVDLAVEGSVKRPDIAVQQDQIGQEPLTIAIVASDEGSLLFSSVKSISIQKRKLLRATVNTACIKD